MAQVNHLTDELKRTDLQYELEKADNQKTLEDMRGQIDALRITVQTGVTSSRDTETRVRLQDERVREMREILEALGRWSKDTDRYIAVYEPIRTMNMVSEALTKSLGGSMLNKAIQHHEERYKVLEEKVKKEDVEFKKLEYTIPKMPELVEEGEYHYQRRGYADK